MASSLRLLFSLAFVAVGSLAELECPSSEYVLVGEMCYRRTAAAPQAEAVTLCTGADESLLEGKDIDELVNAINATDTENAIRGQFAWTTAERVYAFLDEDDTLQLEIKRNKGQGCTAVIVNKDGSGAYRAKGCETLFSAICKATPTVAPTCTDWNTFSSEVLVVSGLTSPNVAEFVSYVHLWNADGNYACEFSYKFSAAVSSTWPNTCYTPATPAAALFDQTALAHDYNPTTGELTLSLPRLTSIENFWGAVINIPGGVGGSPRTLTIGGVEFTRPDETDVAVCILANGEVFSNTDSDPFSAISACQARVAELSASLCPVGLIG